MPKLNPDQAQRVAEAESSGGLMDEGIYVFRLHEVKVEKGAKGPLWNWVYKIPEDTDEEKAKRYKNWSAFNRTSLSEKASWKLNETFEAFGVPTDTDTDDLIGGLVRLQIGHDTIQDGKREGELTYVVEKVLPLDPAAVASSNKGSHSKDDDPMF